MMEQDVSLQLLDIRRGWSRLLRREEAFCFSL